MPRRLPHTITALIVTQGGYNARPEGGIAFESLDPYLELGEVAVPVLADQQVLIEVAMAAINPSDLHFLKGEYGQPRIKGAPAGFEGVGTVIDSGQDGYAQSLIGQRVSFVAAATGSGSWATHAVTDAPLCIPMPDSVGDHDAAGFIVNPLTAAAMFDQVQEADSPAVVLTAGASQVSKFVIALARDAGVGSIPIVRRDDHSEHLRELGASVVLNQNDADFDDRLRAAIKEHRPRFLLDAVADSVSTQVFNAMGRQSTWLIYGSLSPEVPPLSDPGHLVFMAKQIRGFWLSPWLTGTPLEDKLAVFGEVQARFSDGRWSTDVGATIELTDAMEMLAGVLAVPGGKVFLRP
jgi:NADPH:quinone reductase-like Zn-dependent oxidoreductase